MKKVKVKMNARTWLLVLLLAAVASAAASALAVFLIVGRGPTADERAIEQACLGALVADQTLAVRLATADVVVTPQSIESDDTSPITQAQAAELKAHAAREYALFYGGDLLGAKVRIMGGIIDHAAHDNVRYFGGGVEWMTFNAITIHGSDATVAARAAIWSKLAQVQGAGVLAYATPRNQEDYTFTLTETDGHWRITAEAAKFVPGYGP